MQGQDSSPASPGGLELQILGIHRHLYKMGYSAEDGICTYQRDKSVEVKAMKFCHNQGWEAGRTTWPESY